MPSKRDDRCRRANERQEARAKRTPQEQLKRLDEMLGEGKGAAKERARLEAAIKSAEEAERAELEKAEKKEQDRKEKKAKEGKS